VTGSEIGIKAKEEPGIAVLIPAYNPDAALPELVDRLRTAGVTGMVVIDDGSQAGSAPFFDRLKGKAVLLRHPANLGKGAALRTGFRHVLEAMPGASGLVTADADGQHAVDDILRIRDALAGSPDRLILGVRSFPASIPLRSRFGNLVTRRLFQLMTGRDVRDTQTGLRGIPRRMLPAFLELKGDRYEYEMNMLVTAVLGRSPVEQVGIATIYIDQNRASSFRPLVDSARIYFLFLKFVLSSLLAFAIDTLVFLLVYYLLVRSPLVGILCSRAVSALVNFLVNRNLVFGSRKGYVPSGLQYGGLLAANLLAAYGLIKLLSSVCGLGIVAAKIIAETLLFIVSYLVQRDFIFTREAFPADGAQRPA
jgi:glycosyltransferase involved in cell wall biosynthesis